MDFLKYYERELTFTREMAAEFARRYPKVAARLLLEPDKCEDPHMERLMEAFAFECARLHMKIDDDFPEIVEPLLNMVFPHFIRPIPAMAVVRFEPETTTVAPSGYGIQKNAILYSKEVGRTDCKFTTVYPVTLWPAEVVSAGLREPAKLIKDAKQAIVIQLKTCNGLGLDQIGWETLRFFINGPKRQAFHLYELLLNNSCQVEYVASNQQGNSQTIIMTPSHIQPVGFEPDEAMLPSLRKEFPGYLLLFEYFCFPEKFLFIDFKGLEQFRPKDMDTLELWIYLDREVIQDLEIDGNTFSIHATPVVNLFRHITDSINVEQHKSEYRLMPDSNPDAAEIYSIDKVIGTTTGSAEIEFKPLYSLRHHLHQSDDPGTAFWLTKRRPSGRKNDDGTEVFLSFADLDLKPAHPAVEQLVIHADCTNRDLPARLPYGDPAGDLMTEGSVPVRRTNFALKPTATRRPALGGVLQWQALSSLKPNYLPLMRGQEEAFKAILRLYDFDNSPVTRRIIDGIRTIQSQHVTRRIGQAFFRGVEITIGFEASEYAESGLYMFTSVLERFLSQFVSSNSFTQLVARTLPGGNVFKIWQPRRGVRPLL
jgi:type VI secretion system protein ImpG